MVYCMKCGAKLPEDAYFCPKCGVRTLKGEAEGISIPPYERRTWRALRGSKRYKVKDEKSFSGKIGTKRVFFQVDNFNGPVVVSSWDNPEYHIDLKIVSQGYTEEEARENLKELKIDLLDEVGEDVTRLVLQYDYPQTEDVSYSIDVDVKLPNTVEVDLDVRSSNGTISLTDLKGDDMKARTSNGRIILKDLSARNLNGQTSNGNIQCRVEARDTQLHTSNGTISVSKLKGEYLEARTSNGSIVLGDISVKKITARTSNGRIEGEVDSEDAQLSTSNGGIELTIPGISSGDYNLHTSKGSIALDLSSMPDVGYDLNLRTNRGRVRIDLPDLEYRWTNRAHVRAKTRNYEDKNIKISIEAHTSTAGIRVKS